MADFVPRDAIEEGMRRLCRRRPTSSEARGYMRRRDVTVLDRNLSWV